MLKMNRDEKVYLIILLTFFIFSNIIAENLISRGLRINSEKGFFCITFNH